MERGVKTPLQSPRRLTLRANLAKRTLKQSSGCWEIQGHKLHSGHVLLAAGSLPNWTRVRAHVFAWEDANDRNVPDGMVVMHSCDNPHCVNPAHLIIGTQADNIRDSVSKGRFTAWHRTGRRLNGSKPNRVQPRLQPDSPALQQTLRPFDEPHLTLERVPRVTVRISGELALLPHSHSR